MWATIGIAALIALYAGYVIRKRVKEIRRGKYCSCACEKCEKCEKNY